MIYVAFAFNLGLYRTFIEAGREQVYIDEGYVPLLRTFRKHPRIKANLFLEGLTSLSLKDSPECERLLRAGLADGQFELGTYTFNHPVLTLLPYEDSYRQWEAGRRVDEQVWGVAPTGAMMPEAAWDPTNAEAFSRLGVEWVLLGTRVYFQDFPDHPHHDARRAFSLLGTGGSRVKAVCHDCDDEQDDAIFYICSAVIHGAEESIRAFRARVDHHLSRGGEGMLMAVKEDGEFVYEESLARKYGRGWNRLGFAAHLGEPIPELTAKAEEELDAALSGYEETQGVAFVTVSEYFQRCPPAREIMLRASAKGYREWMEGSEKLGQMLGEAQTEIRIARAALQVGRALGAETAEAEGELERAWEALLTAETSTGRRACAHPAGKASRIVWAMEHAMEATRRARGAVALIRAGRTEGSGQGREGTG